MKQQDEAKQVVAVSRLLGTLAQHREAMTARLLARYPIGSEWISRRGNRVRVCGVGFGHNSDDPSAIADAQTHRVVGSVWAIDDDGRHWTFHTPAHDLLRRVDEEAQ